MQENKNNQEKKEILTKKNKSKLCHQLYNIPIILSANEFDKVGLNHDGGGRKTKMQTPASGCFFCCLCLIRGQRMATHTN